MFTKTFRMTIFIISLVVLLSISCSEAEHLDTAESLSPNSPVQITAITPSDTKGAIVEEVEDMGSIGLYCSWTSSATATESWKMENQRYYIDGDDWVIDGDAQQWGFDSLNDKYTFFAYSPYYVDSDIVTPEIVDGELVIHYEVPPQSIDQPDLMYAMPRKDIFPQASGCVSLTFYHALACISFSVSTSTDTTITAINMTGVISSGSLKWDYDSDPNVPCWDINYPEEGEEVNYETFSVKVANYTTDTENAVQVNAKKGYLMMIPQVIGDDAQVTLSLSTGDEKSFTIPAHSEWEAGLKYRYTILLDEESGDDDDECDFIFDSTQISNCYIINPTEGEETIVQIPIEDRINDFWENYYSFTSSTKIKANSSTSEFIVSTVWEDFSTTLDYSYEILDDSDKKMAVKFLFPAAFQEGNFVFTVEQVSDSGTKILWSWHLWFTNYRPDEIAEANRAKIVAGEDMEYTLGDYNGAVHRYADKGNSVVWSSSGMYGKKFIMDRNIGERSERNTAYGAGTVYYQFGRKDPFPGVGAKYGGSDKTGEPGTRSSGGRDFYESVYYVKDFFFIGSAGLGTWSDESGARDNLYIWFDDDILSSGYTEGKSIFDPSPLGWRVPVSDTWRCFKNTTEGMTSWNSVGKYYYYGYRNPLNSGAITADCETGYVWSIDQCDIENATCFSYSDTVASSATDMYITYGFPIRAIEE